MNQRYVRTHRISIFIGHSIALMGECSASKSKCSKAFQLTIFLINPLLVRNQIPYFELIYDRTIRLVCKKSKSYLIDMHKKTLQRETVASY